MQPYPQKKVITFNKHVRDFTFNISYGDLNFLSSSELRWAFVQFCRHMISDPASNHCVSVLRGVLILSYDLCTLEFGLCSELVWYML